MDLQVKWINFLNHWGHILVFLHHQGTGFLSEFTTQVFTHRSAETVLHVIIETFDI